MVLALCSKLAGSGKLAMVFFGDGASSEGEVHEAMNLASVWDLPVLFVVENNGYGLSTPASEQFRCERLSDRALGLGMDGFTIDGNDFLEVYQTVRTLATRIREHQRPVLLECATFRMRGHEEASGVKYVPKELFERWEKKDPVARFEKRLRRREVLTDKVYEEIVSEITEYIEQDLQAALDEEGIRLDPDKEQREVYSPYTFVPQAPMQSATQELRFV